MTLFLVGVLPLADLLPTIHQLAEQFDTSYFTVQTALTPLVEEGLIERRRRVGTIVKHNPTTLTCAGIYCTSSVFDESEYAFFGEMCRQLQRQLSEQQVRPVLHIDMRAHDERSTVPADLAKAIETCEIQALFVPLCDQVNVSWLSHLPLPASFITGNPLPNRVDFDRRQMVRLAMEHLRDQGCRTVGLISAITDPKISSHSYAQFYDAFVDGVSDMGLRTCDAWVRMPSAYVTAHEAYGYESFQSLWQQDERPDGIFVYPDISARGVIMATLALGVQVPRDLKLVLHRNTGVELTCPLPVAYVQSDVARWAAEMIKQVRLQKAGGTAEPVILDHTLRQSGSAKQ